MAKTIGYTLNSDRLADVMGHDPSPYCLQCSTRAFAPCGKVTAKARRMLGIAPIPASQSGRYKCRQCGKSISKGATS